MERNQINNIRDEKGEVTTEIQKYNHHKMLL